MLGFSLYPHHLKGGSDCALQGFCEMIARTAEQMGGVERLGIGSDLCQDQPDRVVEWMRVGRWTKRVDYGEGLGRFAPASRRSPIFFRDNRDFPRLAEGLRTVGFDGSEVEAILGGNWLRILRRQFRGQAMSALRPPDQVMRLARMGASHPTRLSFMRVLLRGLKRGGWQAERTEWAVDETGVGHAV